MNIPADEAGCRYFDYCNRYDCKHHHQMYLTIRLDGTCNCKIDPVCMLCNRLLKHDLYTRLKIGE